MKIISQEAPGCSFNRLCPDTLRIAGQGITVPLEHQYSAPGGQLIGNNAFQSLYTVNMTIGGVSGEVYTISVIGKCNIGASGTFSIAKLFIGGTLCDTTEADPQDTLNTAIVFIGSYSFTSSGSDTIAIEVQWEGASGGQGALFDSNFVAFGTKR